MKEIIKIAQAPFLRLLLSGLFTAILIFTACSGPVKTSTNTTTTTAIPEPPSAEELAEQGFLLPELPRVTCKKLKQMIDDGEPLVLVDTRIEFFFNMGHIAQSVNTIYWPDEEEPQGFLTLPKDRPIIFYCDWPDDWDSASMVDRLLKMDTGINPENVFVLWKGYFRWQELGYPIISTQMTTITSAPETTTTTTPTVTNDESIPYQVLDLVLPVLPGVSVENPFRISVVVTNTTNSQVSCDIPMILYPVADPTNILTYIISVALNTGETKEVSSDDIYVLQGSYMVEAGNIIKSLEVGWAACGPE